MISTRFLLLALTLYIATDSSVDAQRVLRGGRRKLTKSGAEAGERDISITIRTKASKSADPIGEDPETDSMKESFNIEISESLKPSKSGNSEEVTVEIEEDIEEEEEVDATVDVETDFEKIMEGEDFQLLAEQKVVDVSEQIDFSLSIPPKEAPVRSTPPTAGSE